MRHHHRGECSPVLTLPLTYQRGSTTGTKDEILSYRAAMLDLVSCSTVTARIRDMCVLLFFENVVVENFTRIFSPTILLCIRILCRWWTAMRWRSWLWVLGALDVRGSWLCGLWRWCRLYLLGWGRYLTSLCGLLACNMHRGPWNILDSVCLWQNFQNLKVKKFEER